MDGTDPGRHDEATPPGPAEASATAATATPADLLQQLTAMTSRLWGLPAPGSSGSIPALPAPALFPQVGTLSAQQVAAMASTVRAQRQSIAALSSQLQAFDENLASLEQLLEPLRAWTSSWAALERGLTPPTSSDSV